MDTGHSGRDRRPKEMEPTTIRDWLLSCLLDWHKYQADDALYLSPRPGIDDPPLQYYVPVLTITEVQDEREIPDMDVEIEHSFRAMKVWIV